MKAAFALFLCAVAAFADFEYRSTVRAGATPQLTTVALHGGRMLRKGVNHIEIIDVDKRTLTTLDTRNRTWSTMTFDQFRQALAAAAAAPAQQPDVNVSAGIRSTGQTRTIDGYATKESVVTMSTTGLAFEMHLWIAPEVPGYSEVRDFYRRLSKDFDWLPSTAAIRDRSGIARLAGRLLSQSSLLEGTPIETDITIRPDAAGNSAPPLQLTIENSGFSAAPADPALFEIPSGFTQAAVR